MTEQARRELGKILWNIADARAGVGFISLPDGLHRSATREAEQRKLPGGGGEKLTAPKTHKNGLMQQFFPDLQETISPRPVSGRGAGGEGAK